MFTLVPPLLVPELGVMDVTDGAELVNVNPFVFTAVWESGLVTTTLALPDVCAGVVAVIFVLLTTETLVATVESKVTVAPERKLVPVRVTGVPPAVGPVAGAMELSVGAGPPV